MELFLIKCFTLCVCVCSVCLSVCQWDMANGGDQFGLAERPDSDCMDSPKESKQENPSYTLNSPASPQTASSQQAPACTAEHNVNANFNNSY